MNDLSANLSTHIKKLNKQSGGELSELELIANKHPDGSADQLIAVTARLLTPIAGDRDIWNIFQALDQIDPVMTRGPNALTPSEGGYPSINGPYGPVGAATRVIMVKYALYAGAVLSLYAAVENLSQY